MTIQGKTKAAVFAASFALLAGQGCVPAPPVAELPSAPPNEKKQEEPSTGSGVNDSSSSKVEKFPYYISYTPEVAAQALSEGRPVVYYFWAVWCPICQAEEPKLKSWIETSEHPIAGFRVNYDTESELKARFRVPYQHTTVFLNARGEEVERFTGPVSESTFRAALTKAAGN